MVCLIPTQYIFINFQTLNTFLRQVPAQLINGKKIADDVISEIKQENEEWVAAGNRPPNLSVVLVGEDPASSVYVKNKTKAAAKAGRYELMFCTFISVIINYGLIIMYQIMHRLQV